MNRFYVFIRSKLLFRQKAHAREEIIVLNEFNDPNSSSNFKSATQKKYLQRFFRGNINLF